MTLHSNQFDALEELHVYYLHKESGKLLVLDKVEGYTFADALATFVEYKDRNHKAYTEDYKGVIQYQASLELMHFESGDYSLATIKTSDLTVTGVTEFGQDVEAHSLGDSTLVPLFAKKFTDLEKHVEDVPLPY